jgi:transposase-like protein
MTIPSNGSEILPTDSRGRVRVSRERREELLDEFEKSGLSGAQFARTVGLKYQTFAYWRLQRQKGKLAMGGEPLPGKSNTVEWLETVIDKAQASAGISSATLIVRLPSGAALELAHVSQAPMAAALLRAWEKSPC